MYGVYIRYFWQANHQKYGHVRGIYIVLANCSRQCRGSEAAVGSQINSRKPGTAASLPRHCLLQLISKRLSRFNGPSKRVRATGENFTPALIMAIPPPLPPSPPPPLHHHHHPHPRPHPHHYIITTTTPSPPPLPPTTTHATPV